MALGELTRQLAGQAIKNNMKDVLDALRPADAAGISDAVHAAGPGAPGQSDNLCGTILAQVQAMQKALKEDEELIVLCQAAGDPIRVLEIYVPSWHVVVLTGFDTERNITRIVTPVASLQLVCKALKAPQGAKPVRVGIIVPKPKSE